MGRLTRMGAKREAEAEGGAGGAGRDGHGSKGRGGGRGCRQGKKAAGWAMRGGGKGHGDGRQDGTLLFLVSAPLFWLSPGCAHSLTAPPVSGCA